MGSTPSGNKPLLLTNNEYSDMTKVETSKSQSKEISIMR